MSQNSNRPEPVLTGARQTMLSWSKVIESYDAIPDAYKSFLEPQLAASKDFPYIVLTPPLEKFLRRTNEKLICDSEEAIHILERSGRQVVIKSYPYKSIHMLEIGSILLNSWLTISGPTSEGEASSSTIEFNTATGERHLAPFLKKLRPAPQPIDDSHLKAEKSKFDYLSTPNFKFMNYGKSSLLQGETVHQIIYQPEIRETAWTLLGWTLQRTVSLTHLSILTDKELILIREDERGKEIKGVRYGGVWQYIPLRSIFSVSLIETSDELLNLVISLPSNNPLKKIFVVSSRPELEQFCEKLKKLVGQNG